MSKICGYSCEHNKSGVCQISVCDKRTIMSDKTEIKHLSQSYYDLHEKYYKLQQENQQLKDNWIELKEYISIKLYNTEYLQKMCGCRVDDINHILLDAIRDKMQKLEKSDSNE